MASFTADGPGAVDPSSMHSEDVWEYEYDENENEEFFVALDLPSGISLSRKRKRSDGQTGEELVDAAKISAPPRVNYVPLTKGISYSRDLQILDLSSSNPIVRHGNQVYSCHWTSAIGTDVLLSKKGTPACDSLDIRPLHANSKYSIVAAPRLRLTGTPVDLVPRIEPTLPKQPKSPLPHIGMPMIQQSAAHAHPASTPTTTTRHLIDRNNQDSIVKSLRRQIRAVEDPSDPQAEFLIRLASIKASKGERDQIREINENDLKEGARPQQFVSSSMSQTADRNADQVDTFTDDDGPNQRTLSPRSRGGFGSRRRKRAMLTISNLDGPGKVTARLTMTNSQGVTYAIQPPHVPHSSNGDAGVSLEWPGVVGAADSGVPSDGINDVQPTITTPVPRPLGGPRGKRDPFRYSKLSRDESRGSRRNDINDMTTATGEMPPRQVPDDPKTNIDLGHNPTSTGSRPRGPGSRGGRITRPNVGGRGRGGVDVDRLGVKDATTASTAQIPAQPPQTPPLGSVLPPFQIQIEPTSMTPRGSKNRGTRATLRRGQRRGRGRGQTIDGDAISGPSGGIIGSLTGNLATRATLSQNGTAPTSQHLTTASLAGNAPHPTAALDSNHHTPAIPTHSHTFTEPTPPTTSNSTIHPLHGQSPPSPPNPPAPTHLSPPSTTGTTPAHFHARAQSTPIPPPTSPPARPLRGKGSRGPRKARGTRLGRPPGRGRGGSGTRGRDGAQEYLAQSSARSLGAAGWWRH